jgi:beta-N-acetylhexosaminidase
MRQQLGQLFITGIASTELSKEEETFIKENNIGGVILFAHNYEAPAQLAELVNSIQKLRDDYPLFISVDHEGGRVIRFKKQFTQFPAMGEIALLDSPKTIYEVFKIMGQELSSCGVNLSYAPVCDILSNSSNKVIGDRAFGTTPDYVEKFVSAAIRGLHAEKVLACPKHFPGHGNTKKDSHFELPYVSKSLDELKKSDFTPFYRASRSRAEFMMMAHLKMGSLDDQLPSSLSSECYELMREYLKFKKIIVTDDLEMKAITKHYPIEEASFMALKAGTDMLLYRSMETAAQSFEYICKELEGQGKMDSMFEEKVKRVLACKKQHLQNYQPVYIPKITDVLNNKKNQEFFKELMDKINQTKEVAS